MPGNGPIWLLAPQKAWKLCIPRQVGIWYGNRIRVVEFSFTTPFSSSLRKAGWLFFPTSRHEVYFLDLNYPVWYRESLVAVEHLKCGHFKRRSTTSVKCASGIKDLVFLKKWNVSLIFFYIDYMLKLVFYTCILGSMKLLKFISRWNVACIIFPLGRTWT